MFSSPVGMVGNIAADPEYGTTRDGDRYTRFRLATNERVKVGDQYTDSEGVFHNVVMYGRAAESFERTFVRGDRVAVVGTLEIKAYQDREGNRRQSTQIRATTVAADPIFEPVHIDRRDRGASATSKVGFEASTQVGAGTPELAQATQQQWATQPPAGTGPVGYAAPNQGQPSAGYAGTGWG